MGYLNPTNDFRWILPSETDANSPLSEELMSQIRNNLEAATMDVKFTGHRFEVVSVDSTDTLTIEKVDPGDPDLVANQFNDLTVTFLAPSTAIGLVYTVVSSTALVGAGTATLVLSTSGTINLGNDGVNAGDVGYFMYVNTGISHTHNGVDSATLGVSGLLARVGSRTTTWASSSSATSYSGRNITAAGDFYVTNTESNALFQHGVTIQQRLAMRGIDCYLSIRLANDNSIFSWSSMGTLSLYLYTIIPGGSNNYTIKDDGTLLTEAASTITGNSITISNTAFDTIPAAYEESIRVKLPTLDISSLGLDISEGILVGVRGSFGSGGGLNIPLRFEDIQFYSKF